jgi:sugar phosphate isomerase/epimerase
MHTRREFGKIALAGLATVRLKPDTTYAAPYASINSTFGGVHVGAQTYSFRDLPHAPGGDAIDNVIKALVDSGIGECELWATQLEPQFPTGARGRRGDPPSPEAVKAREDIRKWRIETPIQHFRDVKKKFDAAGITVTAFCYNMNMSFTDAELERGFEITKAFGTDVMTTSTTLDVARRLAPMADKHRIRVGMHGHSNVTDPNEFATPDSFAAAMKMSKYFKVNLDIGHFTSANFDSVAYIKQHHADTTNLHIKDRKKNQGDNTPWGQGDTPIREVLQLIKRERWPIPVDIEYEYRGPGNSVDEVKKCLEFVKQALA